MLGWQRERLFSAAVYTCGAAFLGLTVGACGSEDPHEEDDEIIESFDLAVEQSVDGGLTPLSVDFEALVDAPDPEQLDFYWEFGEEGEAEGRRASFSFEQPGSHIVAATAKMDDEVVARGHSTVRVDDFDVEATADITEGYAPLAVSFSCESSADEQIDYRWEFGDGEQSRNANTTYTYNQSGSYVATCIGTGPSGASVVDSVDIEVNASTDPEVTASASPTTGSMPLEVDFEALVVGGDEPFSYEWDPGDDSGTVEESSFTHTYEEEGSYTATLTVEDDAGSVSVDTVNIYVDTEPPVAEAELVDDDEACVLPGSEIEVDASGSYSHQEEDLGFEWSLVTTPQGANAWFDNRYEATTTLSVSSAGTYEFRVFVTEGAHRVGSDILEVVVDDDPHIDIVSGDGQTGVVGQALDEELSVHVENGCELPMAGANVTWEGENATPEPSSYTVESDGMARTEVTLGASEGDAIVIARIDDTSVEFAFSAEVGEVKNVFFIQPDESVEVSDENATEIEFIGADEFFNPVDDEGSLEFQVALYTEEGQVAEDAWFDETETPTKTIELEDGTASAVISSTRAERIHPVVISDDVQSLSWIELYEETFDALSYQLEEEEGLDDEVWSLGGSDNWEIGEPTSGPAEAVAGDHALATILDGDYLDTGSTASRASIATEALYTEWIPIVAAQLEFSHHLSTPDEPHGAECELAMGQIGINGNPVDLAGQYDGVQFCTYQDSPSWYDGFAATGSGYSDVELTVVTPSGEDSMTTLDFMFGTSGDSENNYFFSEAGWFVDDLHLTVLAVAGYVDFYAGDKAALEVDSSNGVVDDDVAGPVVEFALTDEFGNRVYEEGVELYAWLDPEGEMDGEPEFVGVADDRGDNFATYVDGLEASVETDEYGVAALSLYNDEAEAFAVDVEIESVGEDSRQRVEGYFVGLEYTVSDTVRDGVVGDSPDPAHVEIRAYDNLGDPLTVSGIEFEVTVDEEEPVEFTDAIEGSNFSTQTADGEHIATVTSDSEGRAVLELSTDADEPFDVEVTAIADGDETTESTEVVFFNPPILGDRCSNPFQMEQEDPDWIGGEVVICGHDYSLSSDSQQCFDEPAENDVFIEFVLEHSGSYYVHSHGQWFNDGSFELRKLDASGSCGEFETCLNGGLVVELEAGQIYQARVAAPPNGRCEQIGLYLQRM